MTADSGRVVVRNQHPLLPAADIQQRTVGDYDADALYVRQWSTSGQGKGIAVHSDSAESPALYIRASGPAIQVHDASGTLLFEVDATGDVTIGGTLGTTGDTTLTGDTAVTGTLDVTGATTLTTLSTSGAATLNSAGVTGNATVGGTLGVTGAATLSSTLAVTSTSALGGAATMTGSAAGSTAYAALVTSDTFDRFRVLASGAHEWGPGNGARDTGLSRGTANRLDVTTASLRIATAGRGLQIAEGANATMGAATLAAGTVTVNTTAVTANSRIFLTTQSLGTVAAPMAIAVTARSAGTSFTITSEDGTDTSVVAWMIVDPA